MGQNQSGTYTNWTDTPPVNFEGCSALAPGTCTATQGGTAGPGYNLTASANSAGLTWNQTGGLAAANSHANLATGKVGVSGSTGYYQTALAVAEYRDLLDFTIAGANTSTVTNITVVFRLDGSLIAPDAHGATGLGTPYTTLQNAFNFGNANGLVFFELLAANDRYGQPLPRLNQSNSQSGWVSYNWSTISPTLTEFTGVYALTGATQSLGIRNALNGYAATGASFDYGNTSSLSFILPTNVTFTSASGVFLNANNNAVPEPATWAMMLFGFGLVGSAMRRGRRSIAIV
jgi:hypothetical protein